MDYNPDSKTRQKGLLGAAFLAVLLLVLSEYVVTPEKDRHEYGKAAAVLMHRALDAVKKEKQRIGIAIESREDPNGTGIIGEEYSDLTSTLGSLSAKRTSTNPLFAAVIVDMIKDCGLTEGDRVAITFSGSFPALNIAALSAVHTLKLNPIITSSIGASSYGANHPELTWLDMERVLRENSIFPYRSRAASLGGIIDTQGGLDGTGMETGLKAIQRNQVPFLDEKGKETLIADIQKRLELFEGRDAEKKIELYINVGGSLAALGNCPESYSLRTGLLKDIAFRDHPQKGIIFIMSEQGIPVIHLLNIKKIARRYGLPIDPVPLPELTSTVMPGTRKPSRFFAAISFVVLCVLLFYLNRKSRP